MPHKILVVDDDPALSELVQYTLEQSGYAVRTALNGQDALRHTYAFRPDLVLLDVMMPGLSGWEVCAQLRRMCDVPIIMLTAKVATRDKIRGFDLGADDYLTKPVDMAELVARVNAHLRRVHSQEQAQEKGIVYHNGDLVVDLIRSEVLVAGRHVDLTATEFRLLAYMVKNAGRLLSHRALLQQVWGDEYMDEVEYLKTYVSCLRRKLEADPHNPRYILTERGLGYRILAAP